MDAVTVPLIELELTVPVVDALMVQPLHESEGKAIEYVPSLATAAVPVAVALQLFVVGPGSGIPSSRE